MLILVGWLSDDLKYRYNESVEETLVDIAHLLAESAGQQLVNGALKPDQLQQAFSRGYARRFDARIFELEKTYVDMHVYVTDAQGNVIFHSLDPSQIGQNYSQWNDVARTLAGKYGARSTRDLGISDDDIATAYVAAPIILDEQIVGVVSVGKPKESVRRFLGFARQNLAYATLIAAVSMLLLAFVISRWVSQPLAELAQFANRVSRGDRVEPPEFATVIDADGHVLIPGLIDAHWHGVFATATIAELSATGIGYWNLKTSVAQRDTLYRVAAEVR